MCYTWQAVQSSSCQAWMLAWGYRKQNLLKELLGYHADILCLQEVGAHQAWKSCLQSGLGPPVSWAG